MKQKVSTPVFVVVIVVVAIAVLVWGWRTYGGGGPETQGAAAVKRVMENLNKVGGDPSKLDPADKAFYDAHQSAFNEGGSGPAGPNPGKPMQSAGQDRGPATHASGQ